MDKHIMAASLTSYWFFFPDNPEYRPGYGVTAWSQRDAEALLDSNGLDWHRRARRVSVNVGATPSSVDEKHVAPNSGPHVVRGVWFPNYTLSDSAPQGSKPRI